MTANLETERGVGTAGGPGTAPAPGSDASRGGPAPDSEVPSSDSPAEGPLACEVERPTVEAGGAPQCVLSTITAGACVVGLAFLAWAATAGKVTLPVGPTVAAPIAVVLAGLVCGAIHIQRRAAFRTRMRYVADAVIRLAEGKVTSKGNDPLSSVLLQVAGRVEERARSRLKEQEIVLRAESKRDMVRVRSQCEKLVEKYAERALEDRKAAQRALDEMTAERERERRQQEIDRQVEENRLHEAEETARELRERVAALEAVVVERREENLQLAAEVETLLRDAEKCKGLELKFFDKVAAQLRGPIQIISNLAGELAGRVESGGDPPAWKPEDRAKEVHRRAGHLGRLVDQLLDLCRIQSSSMSVVLSEVDVPRFAARVVSEMGAEAKSRGVQLIQGVSQKVPPVLTEGRLFAKIVRELVGNAIHFTPRGGRVTIAAELLRGDRPPGCPTESENREYLRVAVSDTGPGIAPPDRDRIFDAFERGTDPRFTVSDAKPGLGLTLARSYARFLGGDLGLETEVGQGSTFSLCLPVKVYARVAF